MPTPSSSVGYCFGRTLQMPFDDAVQRTASALGEVGFGVLSDIDVQATLKSKLGLERPAYRILGACNPRFAARALAAEPQIGVLLPCNVVVRSLGDAGADRVRVDVMDPNAVLSLVQRREIAALAGEVRALLEQMLVNL